MLKKKLISLESVVLTSEEVEKNLKKYFFQSMKNLRNLKQMKETLAQVNGEMVI